MGALLPVYIMSGTGPTSNSAYGLPGNAYLHEYPIEGTYLHENMIPIPNLEN